MKKVFLVLCVFAAVLSLAAFAFAQQRGYQGGESSQQYGTQDQQRGQYGTQDQYGRQDRSNRQYGKRDQQGRSEYGRMGGRKQMGSHFSSIGDLMDKKVQTRQGEDLGQIDDVIMTRNGQVAYLIIARGGVLGVGDNHIPVPFRSAEFDRQQNAVILPNINKQALENAPTISKDDWQKLEDPNFERQVFSYYGRQGQQRQQGMGEYQQQRGYQQERDYQQQSGKGAYQQQRPTQQQSGPTTR
ncbi:MAG: PRC-barrel domain containing protein [Desulfobacteraceae bacterium]|nr:MAG: PRC-barrel domain containing protein [Desulfobacteraceae bacterium]